MLMALGNKILEDPIKYAFAFLIVLIALGIFIRMVGNPVTYLIDKVFHLLPVIISEFKGKSGKAGIVNIIIVFSILLLAFLILFRPSILSVFTSENNYKSFSLLIMIVAVVSFLVSLVLVINLVNSARFLKKD